MIEILEAVQNEEWFNFTILVPNSVIDACAIPLAGGGWALPFPQRRRKLYLSHNGERFAWSTDYHYACWYGLDLDQILDEARSKL